MEYDVDSDGFIDFDEVSKYFDILINPILVLIPSTKLSNG